MEKRRKRKWAKEWLLERTIHSDIYLVNKLKLTEPEDYTCYLRMKDEQFQELLSLVDPFIKKQDTLMRTAISSEQRLILTLRFLATMITAISNLAQEFLLKPSYWENSSRNLPGNIQYIKEEIKEKSTSSVYFERLTF